MSKIKKLISEEEAAEKPVVVVLEIPFSEAVHLQDLCLIHEDYKQERETLCIYCNALLQHLSKGMRKSLAIKYVKLTPREMAEKWTR